MTEISVHYKDNINCYIECEKYISQEMYDYFSFYADGYRFMPAYKNRTWDGKIRLYCKRTSQMMVGLVPRIVKFAHDYEYSISVDDRLTTGRSDITVEDIEQFTNTLNLPFKPRDYQINSVHQAITNKRLLVVSATGSGKSLIIYCIIRWLLQNQDENVLLIVPTTSLVSQMFSDFEDYAQNDEWVVDDNVHEIVGGREKETEKRVVISTWQSIFKLGRNWFNAFGSALVDETHLAVGKSIQTIMGKCNAEVRLGFTGSLDSKKVHRLILEGTLGQVFHAANSRDLIDRGDLSELKIKCLTIDYPEKERASIKGLKYQDEIDWIINNEWRNNFIAKLAIKQTANTMIFVSRIEHGERLYSTIKELSDKPVFLLNGSINVDEREEVRKRLETEENAIVIASFQLASAGVNIKNLHNVIFAHPSKSTIRVIQSIGRGLRKHHSKDYMTLFDIVDDLTYKSKKNFSVSHFIERVKIYAREKFLYKMYHLKAPDS